MSLLTFRMREYILVFSVPKKTLKKNVVAEVNKMTKSIRKMLGDRVRHQLRIIPELQFYEDDSLDYIERIDSLLKE